MAEKYDGWVMKDKHGDYWLGTFYESRDEVITQIDNMTIKELGLKPVKVKLVEVK